MIKTELKLIMMSRWREQLGQRERESDGVVITACQPSETCRSDSASATEMREAHWRRGGEATWVVELPSRGNCMAGVRRGIDRWTRRPFARPVCRGGRRSIVRLSCPPVSSPRLLGCTTTPSRRRRLTRPSTAVSANRSTVRGRRGPDGWSADSRVSPGLPAGRPAILSRLPRPSRSCASRT